MSAVDDVVVLDERRPAVRDDFVAHGDEDERPLRPRESSTIVPEADPIDTQMYVVTVSTG